MFLLMQVQRPKPTVRMWEILVNEQGWISYISYVSYVTVAMLDARGFASRLSLRYFICLHDLFNLYVLDWSRTFYHVLSDVVITSP